MYPGRGFAGNSKTSNFFCYRVNAGICRREVVTKCDTVVIGPENEIYFKHGQPNPYAKPFDNSTYYVYSYIGSCFDYDSVQINVLPTPNIQTVEAQTINQGDTAYLDSNGAITYSWAPAYTLSDPNIHNPLAFPLNTTTYVVTGTAENFIRFHTTLLLYQQKTNCTHICNGIRFQIYSLYYFK